MGQFKEFLKEAEDKPTGYKLNPKIKFKRVGGNFDCSSQYPRLGSLEGCPEEVGGDFDCSMNVLTSLDGCPEKVGGDFRCSRNRLVSLDGAPKKVGGDFICSGNQLTPLIVAITLNNSLKKMLEKFVK